MVWSYPEDDDDDDARTAAAERETKRDEEMKTGHRAKSIGPRIDRTTVQKQVTDAYQVNAEGGRSSLHCSYLKWLGDQGGLEKPKGPKPSQAKPAIKQARKQASEGPS